MKNILYILGFFLLISQSCEKKLEITEIRSGLQFGMCRGYCFTEEVASPTQFTYIKKAFVDEKNYPYSEKKASLSNEKWQNLLNSIDWKEVKKLDETIGCPDCADGGIRWVKISTKDKSFQIKYEDGKTPEALKELTRLMKEYNSLD